MIDYGKITKTEIGTDKDTDKQKYICTVEFSDGEDLRTVQIMNMSGFNSKPLPDQKITVVDLGGGFEIGIATDDEIDADLEDGESEIYSNDPSRSSTVKTKPDGQVVINRGEDWAVRYSELEAQFNELNDKFNDLVTAYNAHIHNGTIDIVAETCVVVATTSQASESTADITTTKVDSINVP